MKKVWIGLVVVVMVALVGAYAFRQQISIVVIGSQIAPEHDFAADLAPSAPDYSDPAWWAALPSSDDPSDQMPEGVTREALGVAVFFVHPTSYFGKESWNQPLAEESANWVVDQRVLRHQASVFNSCCDVYAPRYRQATFFSFMDQDGNGKKALALAYNDVVAAFDYFLTEIDPIQPFIVAGHSQGSKHTAQLVSEHISGTDLHDRMVAAYLIGFGVTDEHIGEIGVCQDAGQTGCVLGWNVMDGQGAGAFGGIEGLICTNPLNWLADQSHAGHELNEGAIGYASYGEADDGENVSAMLVEVGVADAQCQADGQLAVLDLRSDSFPARMFGNSMHVYDYSLFHASIRQNVADRIKAFMN